MKNRDDSFDSTPAALEVQRHSEPQAKNPKENKSAVILSPKVGVGISGAGAESVVGDGTKTNHYSAQRDLYTHSLRLGFKMTMPMLALVLVLTCGIISESLAGCNYASYHGGKCLTWNPGVENNCGQGCTYTYENGTVYIKTSGTDATIHNGTFSPASYDGNRLPVALNNFVIDGAVSLGANTFTETTVSISGADGNLILTGIDHHAFGDNATLLSGNIIITADAKFGSLAFHGVTLAQGAKIYCAVENCAQKMREACSEPKHPSYENRCLSAVNSIISNNKLEQAPENCAMFSSAGCLSCASGYAVSENKCKKDCMLFGQVEYKGQCYDEYPFAKKRWTPAEANQWLHDGNDNFVILTFKK